MTPILVRVRSIVYETSEQLIKHNKLKVLLSCSPIQGEQSACIRARPTGTEPLVQWLFSTYVCVCTGTVSVKSLNHCLSRKVYVLRSTLHTVGNVSCFSLYSTHRESKRGKENGVTDSSTFRIISVSVFLGNLDFIIFVCQVCHMATWCFHRERQNGAQGVRYFEQQGQLISATNGT